MYCKGCFASAEFHLIMDGGLCFACLWNEDHEALIQAETEALDAALSHDLESYERACERVREAERREAMHRHPAGRSHD